MPRSPTAPHVAVECSGAICDSDLMAVLVANGAQILCDMGTTPSLLTVTPGPPHVAAAPAPAVLLATVSDFVPMTNIKTFGMCELAGESRRGGRDRGQRRGIYSRAVRAGDRGSVVAARACDHLCRSGVRSDGHLSVCMGRHDLGGGPGAGSRRHGSVARERDHQVDRDRCRRSRQAMSPLPEAAPLRNRAGSCRRAIVSRALVP